MRNLKFLLFSLTMFLLLALNAESKDLQESILIQTKYIAQVSKTESFMLDSRTFEPNPTEINKNLNSRAFNPIVNLFKRLFGIKRGSYDPNYPPRLDTVTLNKTKVIAKCPNKKCSDKTQSVIITAHAIDPENDSMLYIYTVSAGKVSGNTSKVTWDLSEAPVGKHTVEICADDGRGLCARPAVMEIEVVECSYC